MPGARGEVIYNGGLDNMSERCKWEQSGNNVVPLPFGIGHCTEPWGDCTFAGTMEQNQAIDEYCCCDEKCPGYTPNRTDTASAEH